MSVRDITLEDTFYAFFSTRAFATGIPTVLAGTPAVSAYENNSTTQITAGITLGADHDSVAGLNLLTVVATAANGYEAGKDYALVITTGTVDSVSVVGEVVAEFTIGRSAAAVDLANATDGLSALKALIDTVDNILDTEIPAITAAVITNAAGVDIAADIIALKAETAAILVDTGTTLQAELDAIEAAVITNAAGVDIAADIIALKAETAAILDDTDLIDDATSGLAKIAIDVAAVLVDTGTTLDDLIDDLETRLGTPSDLGSGASIAANLVDIEAQTDDIGAAGAGLTAVPWNANWDAEVQSEVTDALVAIGLQHLVLQTTTIATLATQVSFTLTAGSADDNAYNGLLASIEDVSTGVQRCTGIISDYTGATRTVTLREDPGVFTIATTDKITIVAISKDILDILADTAALGSPAGASHAADIAAIKVDTAAILVDTGTTLDGKIDTIDTNVDSILVDTGTTLQAELDAIEAAVITNAAGVDIAADIIALKAETAAIVVDTNELQTDWTNGGRLDLIIDAVLADTNELQTDDYPTSIAAVQTAVNTVNTDLSNATDGLSALKTLIDAVQSAVDGLNDISVANVLTTQMTESYNADGAAPTVAQALMLILQRLTEFSISATTLTVKKLDGSTPAAVLTLDDASAPTSSTRSS